MESLLVFDIIISLLGVFINCSLAFLLAQKPPGLIGRYRPIQCTIIALDLLRCVLTPILSSEGTFLSFNLARLPISSLLQAIVVATVTSQSSVIIMGFVYRFFTLKGSRLNNLLSAKWIVLIILLTIVQCTAQSLSVQFSEATHMKVFTSLSVMHYFILASSYLHELFEAIKFIIMVLVGYRTHRFILCAIFTKQASRMHRMGLKIIIYQALTHFTFSFLPLIVLPRVTTRFTNYSMTFNGIQALIDPLIVFWLTPEYRKMLRRRPKRRTITYIAATVPNYTKTARKSIDAPRPLFLSKLHEETLFSRYCSKV